MTTVESSTPAEAAAPRRRRLRLETTAAVSAVTVTVALLLFLGATRSSPVFFGDEIGYLANAIALAGGPHLQLDAGSYYPGWSFVLVPLWWAFRDPLAMYQGAVVLSALSQVATIPVLALLGRRLGLTTGQSLLAACAVVALPAHALLAGFALAESFAGLLVAATALAVVAAAKTGDRRWFAAAGALAGAAFVTHGRLAPLVAATLVWAALLLCRKDRRAAAALALPALLVAGAGYAVYRHLELTVYGSTARESTGIARLLGSEAGPTALGGSGQAWYALVATAGLAIPGVLLGVRAVVAEVRARRFGWASWGAVAFLGLVAIGVTYVSHAVGRSERLDLFVYGRYLQPATDLVALLGLVQLVRLRPRHRFRNSALVLASLIAAAAAYCLLAAAAVPAARETRAGWNAMNVLGLSPFTWHHGREVTVPAVQASLVAAAALALLLVLRRIPRGPTWMLIAAVALALAGSIVGQARTVVPAYSSYASAFVLAPRVEEEPGATVSFDVRRNPLRPNTDTAISQNAYQFFLAPTVVPVIDTGDAMPTTDLVITRRNWPAGIAAGWRLIANDARYDNSLWARP
ncbi:hypothetical protein EDF46_0521 [Frondihabitans sp. PhB188]|uniref:hypothetical protein n=1 Tax=Frondihabitans sp. PhB188 TaxID=2485200 RepID=UPI000F47774D|nr:hypothetical protein [Frondihabitans sp. PhB188]ROQ41149.1 hypothetical protein EDF46_0521 [Frondihabitans sp. PhB188]